ncbi:carboxypeptidase-like regulatory domain-containing protein [Flavobacteriaceae bacterium]|nr:carboxypeptidase-like regulatory domain-containing protein [Flavobacteriaceae bacterium]
MNIRFLLFLCLSVITNLYAQQVEISGTIISSEDDLPVIGANILLKVQNAGTTSDFDGNYVIRANVGDILQ